MPPSPTIPAPSTQPQGFVTFEQLLNQDTRWALSEGSLFFEGRGAVQETLNRITRRLEELRIPYAVAGGMALFLHGYRRFTEDVDILVTREGLERIHEELDGRGYLRPFEGSKHLRDTSSKVKIEFLVSGSFPGDGKPKSIAFPAPDMAAEVLNDIRVLKLVELVNLKLASGMTGVDRGKDLIDVGELIRYLKLPRSLSADLHEFVRDKYLEIWQRINPPDKRYLLRKRVPAQMSKALTIEELILENADDVELQAMRDVGVMVDPRSNPVCGYVYLVTHDPAVAYRFGMHAESEFMDLDIATTDNGQ
jgi:hypothetical protein